MLIVGNWKAYIQSTDKAKKLFSEAKRLASRGTIEIVIATPAPYLGLFAPTNRSKVGICAQDLSLSTGGAATGEITAALLANLGVTHVILGHSERRALGETDEIVSEKVKHALANKITPIICIGERDRDVDAKYLNLLRAQLNAVYSTLSPKERMQIIVAYEPIWAIGKSANEAITPADLTEMVLYIRKVLGVYFPGKGAEKVTLIYGGSVEPGNARMLAEGTGIQGFLPGHASTNATTFAELVKTLR